MSNGRGNVRKVVVPGTPLQLRPGWDRSFPTKQAIAVTVPDPANGVLHLNVLGGNTLLEDAAVRIACALISKTSVFDPSEEHAKAIARNATMIAAEVLKEASGENARAEAAAKAQQEQQESAMQDASD